MLDRRVEIIKTLGATPAVLRALVEGVDDARLRRQHLAVLEGLDRAGWERTGRHGEHGEMSLEQYETHVAAEEVDHLAQIARLL